MRSALIVIFCLLVVMLPTIILADTTQTVTINATPGFVGIANAPADWVMNGITGSGKINKNTVYYSNPLGDTTAPSATVASGECRFTITNTSTIAIDLTLNVADFTNGDAITNSDLGTNGAATYGAYGWYDTLTYANKVITKKAASDVLYNALPTTNGTLLWGMEIKTQTNDWTSGTMMQTTANMTAVAD